VAGPLEFALVGVLASILEPLADAGIAVFVVSTFDTDYLMVKECDVEACAQALIRAGHCVGDWDDRLQDSTARGDELVANSNRRIDCAIASGWRWRNQAEA
jgi:hypothetical protein